ncbi:MAG: UDP-N-acetylmuramoyl-L-alanine--D-glutamate ligase [Parvularculaceae bacterium]
MILIPGVQKKKFGLFGLGLTGVSAADALIASGADVFAWDESPAAREKSANTEYRAEHPKEWPWGEISSLIVSPGIPLTHPKPHAIVRKAVADNIEVIGDIELFARAMNAIAPVVRPKVVAVTGSNGKSTTTALIGHILNEAGLVAHVGGNIGMPMLSLPEPAPEIVYVLELSSFQLDLAKTFRPDIAVMLNISPDHLDRHGDMAGYVAAKKRIFMNQSKEDAAIIGVDDAPSQGMCAEISSGDGPRVIPISAEGALGKGAFSLAGKLFYNLDNKTGEAGDIRYIASLRGAHNWQNAAAALAAAMTAGVAPTVAVKAMERFEGLPHRMEIVARAGATIFVNDSKATNADAASRALKSYDEIFWIAGGRAKEGGVASLRDLMKRVRKAYLIGEAAADFETQLAGSITCVQCGDLERAVALAARDAAQTNALSSVVLLSPACASYDQFKNFEERGDEFRRLAQAASRAAGEAA